MAITYSALSTGSKSRTASGTAGSDASSEDYHRLESVQPSVNAEVVEGETVPDVETPSTPSTKEAKVDGVEKDDGNDEADGVKYSYTLFHLSFALASMYIGMLLISWKLDGGTASTVHKNRIDVGESCMYAKIATVGDSLAVHLDATRAILLPGSRIRLL